MDASDDGPLTLTFKASAMSVPWTALITAGSTLVAGFGGMSLKERYDFRRDKDRQRREAYGALMLSLDELRRIFGAPATLDESAHRSTLGTLTGQAVASIQKTYFTVYLTGSRQVQPTAGEAWQAAWDIHNWFECSPADESGAELSKLLENLRAASTAFANAVRKEQG